MREDSVGAETSGGLTLRTLQRNSHAECYLVGSSDLATVDGAGADAHFAEAASVIASKAIQPIQVKIYGRTAVRDQLLQSFAEEFRRRGLECPHPLTYVEGRPVGKSDFAGLQIWGVAPCDRSKRVVTTVLRGGRPVGRCWQEDGFRILHLADVRGTRPDGSLAPDPAAQAEQMFDNAGASLKAEGLSYLRVVRTWIYLARLLSWYTEFNGIRTAHYAREGVGEGSNGSFFPASTGIQGRAEDEECFMDVLAVESLETGGARVEPILASRRQPSAFSYGSSFSRGLALEIEGRKTVFVSGTASINPAGQSVHIGDEEAQCVETLRDIEAILQDQGGGLDSICSATVFCKNREAYAAFRKLVSLGKVPAFPAVHVLADVCRSDLLIEIEAAAMI